MLIIAALATLIMTGASSVFDRARKTQAKNDEIQIVTAVNAYYTEYGKYPMVDANFNATDGHPAGIFMQGGLLQHPPLGTRSGDRTELPPALLAAVIYTESKFDASARSHAGAVGLIGALLGAMPSPPRLPMSSSPSAAACASSISWLA